MMKKQNKINIRAIIFWIIVPLVLIAGCTVNIVFACIVKGNANLFTAIGGWIGFLATAGVGVITLLQNRKYNLNSIKTYRIDNLIRARDYLRQIKSGINKDNYDTISSIYFNITHGLLTEVQYELKKCDILLEMEQVKIDLLSFRYYFEEVIKINNAISDFMDRFKKLDFAEINEDNFKQIEDKYKQIIMLFELAVFTISNFIDTKITKSQSYKEFDVSMKEHEDFDRCNKQFQEETQNGQAEDDVNGQGK